MSTRGATGSVLDHGPGRARPPGPGRSPVPLRTALAVALCVVVAVTLTPQGSGWAWGSPLAELRWYATGLDSTTTVLQLVGNLVLLAVPAGIVVALEPASGRLSRLLPAALVVASAIEVLQWVVPLGRVVSPVDALLNATGAVAAGLLVARVHACRSWPDGSVTRR